MADDTRKFGGDDEGESAVMQEEQPPGRPQNETSHLLPRKRSQATKSPSLKSSSSDNVAMTEQQGGSCDTTTSTTADNNILSTSSPNIEGAEERPASRRDLRATPDDMKHSSINLSSQLLHTSADDDDEEINVGGEGEEADLSEARASLNASFEAAAKLLPAASSSVLKMEHRSSPKRRKQSFDAEDEKQYLQTTGTTQMRPGQDQHQMMQQKQSIIFAQQQQQLRPPRTTQQRRQRKQIIHGGIGIGVGEEGSSRQTEGLGGAQQQTPSPKDSGSHSHDCSTSLSHSPATPFKFHSFPASLPRVHHPPVRDEGIDGDNDGSDLGEPVGASDDCNIGGNVAANANSKVGSTPRLGLRPKPSAAPPPGGGGERPPPSPASRRLFMKNDDTTAFCDNDTHDTNNQNDISGDWSEGYSTKSLTNERIRMTNVPSHVNAASHQYGMLNGLEEEEGGMMIDMEGDNENPSEMVRNLSGTFDALLDDEENIVGNTTSSSQPQSSSMARNLSGTFDSLINEDETTRPIANLSRDNNAGKKNNIHGCSLLESVLHYPHTPREPHLAAEQFHDCEVSPIVRLPEDEDHEMVDRGSSMDGPTKEVGKASASLAQQQQQQPLFGNSASPILHNKSPPENDEGLLHRSNESCSAAANTTASTANINNTSNLSNITHRPTARRLRRPMPDTSAFDVGNTTPSQSSLGSNCDTSGFNSHNKTATSASAAERLLCPPTPIRTPSWAHHADAAAHGLKRANSLITTKVLAACPPRVLDNLSSLEDSMLENDVSGGNTSMDAELHITNPSTALTNSFFAPVEEERDDELLDECHSSGEGVEEEGGDGGGGASCMFRSLSTEHMSPTLQTKQGETSTALSDTMPAKQPHLGSMRKDGNNDNGGPSTRKPSRKTAGLSIDVDADPVITFSDFDNLGILGSGAFADVYKVRSKSDRRLYAIKRTRRQFRGVKDRERAMAEVNTMKRLQSALLGEAAEGGGLGAMAGDESHHHQHQHSKSNYGLYLLFFIRAWQQDGFFYCQTELCSRATARHLRLSLSTDWERDVVRYPSLQLCLMEGRGEGIGESSTATCMSKSPSTASLLPPQDNRLIPERAIWQICHDISRGLYHIHFYGMVHYDIKPSNIFFVYNAKWGTMCKIGDFGLAGDIGTKDDGQEGDTAYMPNELLTTYSCAKHPSADIFSLGMALYEIAASPNWTLPREGDRWHELRSGTHTPDLPSRRSASLIRLIRDMIRPNFKERPSAEDISEMDEVKRANATSDSFLSRFINDVERYDSRREREMESAEEEARRRSSTPVASMFNNHALANTTASRRAKDMRTPTNDE